MKIEIFIGDLFKIVDLDEANVRILVGDFLQPLETFTTNANHQPVNVLVGAFLDDALSFSMVRVVAISDERHKDRELRITVFKTEMFSLSNLRLCAKKFAKETWLFFRGSNNLDFFSERLLNNVAHNRSVARTTPLVDVAVVQNVLVDVAFMHGFGNKRCFAESIGESPYFHFTVVIETRSNSQQAVS